MRDNVIKLPVSDEVFRQSGISSEELRVDVAPVVLYMRDCGLLALTATHVRSKAVLTIELTINEGRAAT